MNKRITFLIVVGILVLSMGPLSYFMSDNTKVIDYKPEPETKPEFYRVSSTFNTTVIEVDPYINFVFSSGNGEASIIKSKIEEIIGKNYTMQTTFSPYIEGYQYKIDYPPTSEKNYIWSGFKLSYELSPFINWGVSEIPIMSAKVKLPSTFWANTSEGMQNIRTDNDTVAVAMLYSRKVNDSVPIICSDMLITLNYKLAGIQVLCYDAGIIDLKSSLGLPEEYIVFPNITSKIVNATLDGIIEAKIIGLYDTDRNLNETDFYDIFQTGNANDSFGIDVDLTSLTSNQTTFTISFEPAYGSGEGYINYLTLIRARSYFDEFALRKGIKVTNDFSKGRVLLPEKIEIDGKEYVFPDTESIELLPFDAIPKKQFSKQLNLNIVFGEIIDY